MVTIVKLKDDGAILHEMTVAQGVFESSFKHLGWLLKSEIGKHIAKKPEEKVPEVQVPENSENVTDSDDDTEDENLGDDDNEDDDTDDDASLLEKPIAEYTGDEIKRVAKLKGIDISGHTKREAREILKKALINK